MRTATAPETLKTPVITAATTIRSRPQGDNQDPSLRCGRPRGEQEGQERFASAKNSLNREEGERRAEGAEGSLARRGDAPRGSCVRDRPICRRVPLACALESPVLDRKAPAASPISRRRNRSLCTRRIAAARAIAVASGTMRPVRSCWTISGIPPPARAMTGFSIPSDSSRDSPSGSFSAVLNRLARGDERSGIGLVPDEARRRAALLREGLEPSTLLSIAHDQGIVVGQGRGFDGQVHALPRDQAADDAYPKAPRPEGLTRPERRLFLRSPVVGIDAVSDDRRSRRDGGSGRREHGVHVFADRHEGIGARGGPAGERRAAGIEVMHHVVLGAKLGAVGTAGGARPEQVGTEGMRVHDIDALLGDPRRQPRDVGGTPGSIEVRERVVADRTAVSAAQFRRARSRPRGRDSV